MWFCSYCFVLKVLKQGQGPLFQAKWSIIHQVYQLKAISLQWYAVASQKWGCWFDSQLRFYFFYVVHIRQSGHRKLHLAGAPKQPLAPNDPAQPAAWTNKWKGKLGCPCDSYSFIFPVMYISIWPSKTVHVFKEKYTFLQGHIRSTERCQLHLLL